MGRRACTTGLRGGERTESGGRAGKWDRILLSASLTGRGAAESCHCNPGLALVLSTKSQEQQGRRKLGERDVGSVRGTARQASRAASTSWGKNPERTGLQLATSLLHASVSPPAIRREVARAGLCCHSSPTELRCPQAGSPTQAQSFPPTGKMFSHPRTGKRALNIPQHLKQGRVQAFPSKTRLLHKRHTRFNIPPAQREEG